MENMSKNATGCKTGDLAVLQPVAKIEALTREYVELAISLSTRKAYACDLANFEAWGGSIPSTPEAVASYLVCHAEVLSMATLTRRLAAIAKAHSLQGLPSPTSSELVKLTFRGIRRQHGKPQSRVAALTKEDLIVTLATIPDDLRGCRDKAVLLIGFCAALRRSELCRVRVEDLQWTNEGLILTLPRSKTDQTGEGRQIGIPYGRGRICPVTILQDWLSRSGITEGFIFRGIDKGAVTDGHLCDRSIAEIIKSRAAKAGLDPAKLSGHSLRAGLATSAAAAGMASHAIRAQTGHKSDAMLARYIRHGSLFRDNAAALF